ncbi:MAG: EF-P lysine aminoacylase GenX [Gammaproteobacteria bacterium]|nr:EF-P lysine aminoacylase GenX [Gammaproteobacteria bacterium]
MDNGRNNQDWRPTASLLALTKNAAVYRWIREFFEQRDVLEVQTPVLSHAGTTDRHIESFCTKFHSVSAEQSSQMLYLITSPEFHMKRLLAAGSGDIYQLGRVFRQSELGAQHNPEFTLLEWYRTGQDHHQLMLEVAEFVNGVLSNCADYTMMEHEQLSYRTVFRQHLGIDPLADSTKTLRLCAQQHGFIASEQGAGGDSTHHDLYLDFLMSHVVQPKLGQGKLSFVYDYPASQCSLARLSNEDARVAERFELFLNGVELANGFHELCDPQQQQRRFEQDNVMRDASKQTPVVIDRRLIAALTSGLPDCAGVAVGIDRLLQFILSAKTLDDVLAFPFNRA